MRADGRPGDVHVANRGMDIHHGLNGSRRVEVTRGDRRIVAERGGRGYVESRYRYGGREYGHRSYYYHGRAYDHFYHGYDYRGGYVEMYTPARIITRRHFTAGRITRGSRRCLMRGASGEIPGTDITDPISRLIRCTRAPRSG